MEETHYNHSLMHDRGGFLFFGFLSLEEGRFLHGGFGCEGANLFYDVPLF